MNTTTQAPTTAASGVEHIEILRFLLVQYQSQADYTLERAALTTAIEALATTSREDKGYWIVENRPGHTRIHNTETGDSCEIECGDESPHAEILRQLANDAKEWGCQAIAAQPAPGVGGDDRYAEQHARDSKELRKLCESRNFYKRRCEALQALQSNMRDPERKAVCDILANGITTLLSTRPAESVAQGGELLSRIGELIRTQDNRITSHPVFVVEQQRTIYAVDTDYDTDGFDWLDDDGLVSEKLARRLEALNRSGGNTGKYRRLGYKHYWEFVTACFTEQGCKDYLAANGHNLKNPRTYVYSAYRNAEWIGLRELFATPTPATGSGGEESK